MTRSVQLLLVFSICLWSQSAPTNVTSKYHFTTPQTPQSLDEAAALVRTVASVPQVSTDISTATLIFSGPAESVDLAAWILPRIDRAAGDGGFVPEYKFNKDSVARVNFPANMEKPQETQEILTVLRTVADVQKIFTFTPNHALVLQGKDYTVSFAEWIIEQLDQPIPAKPEASMREFTVGGPDFRGMGHGARVCFLATLNSPRQTQEILTILRTVGDIQKVFSFSSRGALVFRANDTDLKRAEWIIQQLDQTARQAPGNRTFAAPSGDDVTRIFPLRDTTPRWVQAAITTLRSEYKIKKIFSNTAPPNIVVRGTSDQIEAAAAWIAKQNALTE